MTLTQTAMSKTPLILTQIASRLHDIFDGHIDLSDVGNKSEAEREQFFLTRAYLALYFLRQSSLTPAEAGRCITDGGSDDGIDGVYVDKKTSHVYFGQAKWRDQTC